MSLSLIVGAYCECINRHWRDQIMEDTQNSVEMWTVMQKVYRVIQNEDIKTPQKLNYPHGVHETCTV